MQPGLTSSQPPARKEPVLAAILSFFLGGVGQIYLGQTEKGAVLTIAILGIDLMACFLGFAPLGLGPIGFLFCSIPGLLGFGFAIGSAVDAYMMAERYNRGETLGKWDYISSRKK